MAFATRANGASTAEAMRISSGGNVGIGTTAPADTLEVATGTNTKGLTISGLSTGISPTFRMKSSDTTAAVRNYGFAMSYQQYGDFIIYQSTTKGGDPIGGNARLTFDPNGNAGIGTTTPGNLLDVNGSGNFDSLYTQATSTSSSLIATSTLEVRSSAYTGGNVLAVFKEKVGFGTSTPLAVSYPFKAMPILVN